MKLRKLYADSPAFSEDVLGFTETWLKPEISEFCLKILIRIELIALLVGWWGADCSYLYFNIGENILS